MTPTAPPTALETAAGPAAGPVAGAAGSAAGHADGAPVRHHAPRTRARRATRRVEVRVGAGWSEVCRADALTPGRGVAALLPCGTQAAVFTDRAGHLHVIGNRDPFTGAYVLSRGLLGSADGMPFVASPLLKQRFDLRTGRCLDDPDVSVPVFCCRMR